MLMDDNNFDDGYEMRIPVHRDRDADLADMKETFDSTPVEKHQQAEADADEYRKNGIVRSLSDSTSVITTLEDPADQLHVKEVARQEQARAAAEKENGGASAPASPDASAPASPAAPGAEFGSPATPASEGGAPAKTAAEPAEKPTSLEATLANIRQTGDRQRRLVISGDDKIKRAFYDRLASTGDLHYQGGAPVISCSRKTAMKILQEVAAEYNGAATHAATLEMNREGRGVLGSISAGLKNNTGFRHNIDVVVVGNPEMRDEKLKELGDLVTTMQRKGHIEPGTASVQDGKLVLSEDGPVKLSGNTDLARALTVVKDKVDTYNAEQTAAQAELRAHDNEKKQAQMAKDREKEGPGDGKDAAEKPKKYASEMATALDDKFKATDLLHTKTDKGQVQAVALLHQARNLGDPHERELQTLPEERRQKAILQMQTIVEKISSGEFDKAAVKELDSHKTGTSSVRSKVADFIAMEAKRDPEFGEKAQPILKDLVERKFLTEAQAETISGKVAEAVTAAKEAAAKEAPAADASKAADAGKDAPAASASADAPKAAEAGKDSAPASASADAKPEAAPAAESKTLASDSTPDLAAKSAAPAEVSKDARIEPTLGNPGDATASTKAAAEAPAPATEKPQGLRDRIEDLVKDGPANLTAEKAHALVAELDGLRSKPLAALDSSSGTNPTRTLVRTEALLKELESGRFGDELKSQAKDLAEPLQKWQKQDVSRFNNDASVKTVSRDDVVAGVKSGMSAWDGAEKSAQKEGAAASPAPSKDQASAATSTPVNPEKASASTPEAAAPVAAPAAKAEAPAPAPQEPASVKAEAPAPAKADAPATATSEAATAVKSEAPAAKVEAAPEVKAAPAPDAAAIAAKEQVAARLTETESAGGKLSQLMANPAGSFTNRDKSWNEENVQRAAKEVMRLDPESMSQLSPQQRAKVVVYATWVAENARDGKLPGFSSEEGKATAAKLVDRAASLIGKLEAGAKTTPDVDKSVEKADRLVDSMAQLQKTASASNQASREDAPRGSIGPGAANALAKDLVHAMYQAKEPREADTKYLLKNASNLTPATTKEMEPQARAQTAVAMSHLAQKVRDGALGEFSKLPSAVQKQTIATANAAETMLTSMGKDPAMRAELNQAYSELHAKTAKTPNAAPKVDGLDKASSASPSASASTPAGNKVESATADKTAKPAAPAVTKTDGRSLDR
jgi:hypothetical protein